MAIGIEDGVYGQEHMTDRSRKHRNQVAGATNMYIFQAKPTSNFIENLPRKKIKIV